MSTSLKSKIESSKKVDVNNISNPNTMELLSSDAFRRRRIREERATSLNLNGKKCSYEGFKLNTKGFPMATFAIEGEDICLQLYANEFQPFAVIDKDGNEIGEVQAPQNVRNRAEICSDIDADENLTLSEKIAKKQLADEIALAETLTEGDLYTIGVTLCENAKGVWEGKTYQKKKLLWEFIPVEEEAPAPAPAPTRQRGRRTAQPFIAFARLAYN